MAQKISQLPVLSGTIPTTTIFPVVAGGVNYQVSLDQLYSNPGFTGTVIVPTAPNNSNNQIAANTSWVRNLINSLSWPIAQGGTGGTTATEARTNLGIGSLGTQSSSSATITGGSLTNVSLVSNSVTLGGGSIDNTPIGVNNPNLITATTAKVNSALNLDLTGSTETNPRLIKFDNVAAGSAARLDFFDYTNAIGTANGRKSYWRSNHGIELYGAATTAVSPTAIYSSGNGASDACVRIVGTSTTHASLLDLSALSTATSPVLIAKKGTNTTFSVSADGAISGSSLSLTTPLGLTAGGTNASSLTGARGNLAILGSKYLTRNSNYTILTADNGAVIDCNATTASFNLILPSAAANPGFTCTLRKTDATPNLISIIRVGSDLINGTSSFDLSLQFQSVTITSNGSNSWILEDGSPSTIASYNASQLQTRAVANTVPTNGQGLIFNGTQWAPRTAGKILQVVYGFTSTQVANTASTFIDIGLSASITPQFSSSKILVTYLINGVTKLGANTSVNLQLLRGASLITTVNSGFTGSAADLGVGSAGNSILDAPNTTAPLTYKVQIANNNAVGTVFAQYFGSSASTIVLMEVSA